MDGGDGTAWIGGRKKKKVSEKKKKKKDETNARARKNFVKASRNSPLKRSARDARAGPRQQSVEKPLVSSDGQRLGGEGREDPSCKTLGRKAGTTWTYEARSCTDPFFFFGGRLVG